jgi:hypothetical protein
VGPVSEQDLATFKRSNIRYWIRRTSDRLIAQLQVIIAIGGLLVVVLLSIPWLDGPLKKAGLTAPGPLSQAIVALVVVSIFFDVRRLTERKPEPQQRHFPAPMDVYPVLLERIHSIARKEEKVLDVIGMTLFTAWPSIRFWLNRTDLNGWTVRLAALADHEAELAAYVPSFWFRDSRSNLSSIVHYANSTAARSKDINLQPFAYDFMPSLHGYRLGNGDLFYSFLHWDTDGKLRLDDFSYDFVPHEDHSPSANAIRETFESWFQRATRTAWRGEQASRGVNQSIPEKPS